MVAVCCYIVGVLNGFVCAQCIHDVPFAGNACCTFNVLKHFSISNRGFEKIYKKNFTKASAVLLKYHEPSPPVSTRAHQRGAVWFKSSLPEIELNTQGDMLSIMQSQGKELRWC